MVLYDWARVGPTTKTSDEISIICLFRLILQANTLFYFVLWYSSFFEFICSFHIFFKWLLNLWKCDDLLRNSFVHLRSNVYCEDYMLQFLSVDSTYLFVYQDVNGCHPLQDGSANASESGSQWRESSEPSATTSTSGGMASNHGSHQRQCSDDSATLARTYSRARQLRQSRARQSRQSRSRQQSVSVCHPQPVSRKSAQVFQLLCRGHECRWLARGHQQAFWM